MEKDFILKIKEGRLISRIRNVIYYYNIDDRPRKQYIHVLREIREDCKEFRENDVINFVYNTIPKQVKSEEIEEVINSLSKSHHLL